MMEVCYSLRYSPQTSICVYSAKDSDYSLASGANNKGVFDIFRSQVYDPVSGRNIANSYVEVGACNMAYTLYVIDTCLEFLVLS